MSAAAVLRHTADWEFTLKFLHPRSGLPDLFSRPARGARPKTNGQPTNIDCPQKILLYFGASAVAVVASFFFTSTGTGLGFPGLGNFNPLCSNPFFFNIDDTVPDGIAP